jgi:hypothetical protein
LGDEVKTLLVATLLALLGLICGAVASSINLAFEPKGCGEDCTNIAWDSLATWALLCVIGFPLVGTLVWKRFGGAWRAFHVVAVVLIGVAIIPPGGAYLYKVHIKHQRPVR